MIDKEAQKAFQDAGFYAQGRLDEIQESTTSMEEKLEEMGVLSACCGAPLVNGFCHDCKEHA